MVETDQFPALILWLERDFHDPAKINMKIPPAVDRQPQNITSRQTDQPLMADRDDVFVRMHLSFLFQKIGDSLLRFTTGLPSGKRKSVERS